ncbi:hypothetical protein [Paucihalobacter sp.]|uniref:hypothetical protein n=1 Tax=Paucihalobacter sp. TaxID=2850405 RepID=UPI003D161C6A
MKHVPIVIALLITCSLYSQETNSDTFWERLQQLCGKSFEGKLIVPENDAQFGGKALVMHVRSCTDTVIKIPLFVGDDKSRTWVLTYVNGLIELKHDHRHQDGSPDETTMYGGTASNPGKAQVQVFPADAFTAELIPAAATNIWWITVNETELTYNLKRVDTPRQFTMAFDLTKAIDNPGPPWGWTDN